MPLSITVQSSYRGLNLHVSIIYILHKKNQKMWCWKIHAKKVLYLNVYEALCLNHKWKRHCDTWMRVLSLIYTQEDTIQEFTAILNLIQQSDLVSSELFYYLAPALKQRICLVKIKYNNNKTYETMCSKIAHVLVSMKQSIK